MSRIDQVNEVLRKEIAQFVGANIKMENGMITVLDVDCSPDFKNAKVYVSVLPDNQFGTALKSLRKNNSALNSFLRRNLKLRKIPKIDWVIDPIEKEASVIERILNEIENEEK